MTFATRIFRAQPGELRRASWSFLTFFCILGGYFILRPIRETLATRLGIENVPYLFTGTFVVMIAAVPVYSWIVARWPRSVAIPWIYRFFIVNIGIFAAVFAWAPREIQEVVGGFFFVWLSVFNLFAVSIFWSVMVEGFEREQGTRLFGPIAAGGSLGALAGSAITASLATEVPLWVLMLVAMAALEAAVHGFARIVGVRFRSAESEAPPPTGSPPRKQLGVGRPIGGNPWSGFLATLRSPLLIGICGFMILGTICATVGYNVQLSVIGDTFESDEDRTRVYALLNFATQGATLLVQLFLISRVLQWLGVTWTLTTVPTVYGLGLAAVAVSPVFAVVAPFEVGRRIAAYAVAKPTKEVLFTGVSLDEKYKAHSFIDTVVYRGGDVIGAWSFKLLADFGLRRIALFALPVVATWWIVAWLLGRRHRANTQVTPPE